VIPGEHITRKGALSATLSVLRVLRVLFAAVVQANQAYAGKSKLPSHECSLCSVAHS